MVDLLLFINGSAIIWHVLLHHNLAQICYQLLFNHISLFSTFNGAISCKPLLIDSIGDAHLLSHSHDLLDIQFALSPKAQLKHSVIVVKTYVNAMILVVSILIVWLQNLNLRSSVLLVLRILDRGIHSQYLCS